MALEFVIKEVEARPTVCIRTKTTMEKLAEIMGPIYGEIMGAVQSTGGAPAGMPFCSVSRHAGQRGRPRVRYSGGFGRREERPCGGERVAWRPGCDRDSRGAL